MTALSIWQSLQACFVSDSTDLKPIARWAMTETAGNDEEGVDGSFSSLTLRERDQAEIEAARHAHDERVSMAY
jgi:hypothetical protein